MPSVNPEILRWARETAGLTLDDASEKLHIGAARGVSGGDRLARLEAGEAFPSRPQLLKMAQVYRRPLVTFYSKDPPKPAPRGEDFRTLPLEYAQTDVALVDALVREVRARQSMVRELLIAEDEAVRLPFVGTFQRQTGAEALSVEIATRLGLNLEQFRSGNIKRGFAYLRERVEAAGVFVLLIGDLGSHHSALNVELFRGLALADDFAPFIVINAQDSEKAWSFTLLHELAHIWMGQTGISGSTADNEVETFCNDVAGRILLPAAELAEHQDLRHASLNEIIDRIRSLADSRQLSYSMVAYKLFREGLIHRENWQAATKLFRARWLEERQKLRDKSKDKNSGPSYYTIKKHRLGNRLLTLSRRMLNEGAITPNRAATILGVRPGRVYALTGMSA